MAKFGDLMSYGSKDRSRNVPCLMYYYHDATDLVKHGMAKNKKT